MLKNIIISAFLATTLLYSLKKTGMIGSYKSKPYISTIHLEPSTITKKITNDGKIGACCSYNYIALYINPLPPKNESTIYYLALPYKAEALKDETYFNKYGTY